MRRATDVVGEIARRHDAVRRQLSILDGVVREIRTSGDVGDFDPMAKQRLERLVEFFRTDVCDLMRLEEEVFFPPLERDLGEIGGPVATLQLEHEEVRRAIGAFARAVREDAALPVIASCGERVGELLRLHIEKEEAAIFPLLSKIFTRADRRRAAQRVRASSRREQRGCES